MMSDYAAVVLAGGAGTRLGGAQKPVLTVGGVPMLHRVLAAVSDAVARVVVGPPSLGPALPPGVRRTSEVPQGGGPVAAAAAGLALVPAGTPYVALLAADLPLLRPAALAVLRDEMSNMDGAVYVDGSERRQFLCGLWRTDRLREALGAIGDPAGQSMRRLVSGLHVADVGWTGPGPPPWYDCDTETELGEARRWAGG